MKKRLEKLSVQCFAFGLIMIIIAGILMALLFFIAFILGGEIAKQIVHVVIDNIFTVIFALNIIFCISGILHVYLIKDTGFCFHIKNE